MAWPLQLDASEAARHLVHLEGHDNRYSAHRSVQHEIGVAVSEIETARQLYRRGPKLARQIFGAFTPIGLSQQLRYDLGRVSGPRQCHEHQPDRHQYEPQSVSPIHEVLSSIFRALAGSALGRTRCNTPSLRVASILSRSMASESVNTRS